jgi:hypothetical protein
VSLEEEEKRCCTSGFKKSVAVCRREGTNVEKGAPAFKVV